MDKDKLSKRLIQAATDGDKEVVENLLSEGAQINYKDG